MIVENIIQIGNPILRNKNKLIKNVKDKKVLETIENLVDTMRSFGMVGTAAPQIGVNLKIFVTEIRKTEYRKANDVDSLRIFINPKIIWKSKKEIVIYEGCASVSHSDFFGPVKRPEKIIVKALNEKGEKIKLKASGLLARVIQHEYDHLVGIEFVEKICDLKKIMAKSEYLKMVEKSK
ncbi:Peptide deformylase 1 [bioreactor metagenome]|uniref:Peptide deformylase 1 n=1 Tax=bioreactor metagenome TaxID=1076179 RepID=A0A644YVK3_9ZZZZ